ncbi:MAG: SDR family oxidoreductase [Acetobacteraceae bacterium]|nr:SDR family oxidoreductase [Acetobacteraceae bacterium]
MARLTGKRCLVTGAGRGIGRAIALAFAHEGAAVAVLDRREDLAAETATALKHLGAKIAVVTADVAQEDSVNAGIAAAQDALGGIDVLVNNAGIDTNSRVADMPVAMWDEMMAVNLRSVFLCTRAVLPGMVGRRWGRIINISSQLAHKGAAEMAHYAAAKAAVIGFTRSLAYEVAQDGITVNAICPGPIDTELFRNIPEAWRKRKLAELPIGRAGTVDEIAPTAVLLASDEGSYYVGATLNPNGGDVMI